MFTPSCSESLASAPAVAAAIALLKARAHERGRRSAGEVVVDRVQGLARVEAQLLPVVQRDGAIPRSAVSAAASSSIAASPSSAD